VDFIFHERSSASRLAKIFQSSSEVEFAWWFECVIEEVEVGVVMHFGSSELAEGEKRGRKRGQLFGFCID
jgi:hypothetical protein